MKSVCGNRIFLCRRTDGQTDKTKLTVAFRNFSDVSKWDVTFSIYFVHQIITINLFTSFIRTRTVTICDTLDLIGPDRVGLKWFGFRFVWILFYVSYKLCGF